MTKSVESAIVRLYSTNRHPVGAGFLVRERHILTCAHVVTEALGLNSAEAPPDWAEIHLNFPLLAPGKYFTTHVCHWEPDADVAGLKMTADGPNGSEAIRLVTSDDLWGHSFRACGFPAGYGDGVWVSGVLRGRTAAGWIQIDGVKEPGYRVKPGFSGTPVWDEQLNGVVGMAVAADTDETVKAAYIIPADILAEAWPGAVRVHHIQPERAQETTEQPGGGEPSGVAIGDVTDGIRNSIIAGRDVHVNLGSRRESHHQGSGLSTDRAVSMKLRQILSDRFSSEELRTMCFDLGVDWDDLPARGKSAKARELVAFFERRERIGRLIRIGRQQRPDIPWSDITGVTE
jgi:hypothetical protein